MVIIGIVNLDVHAASGTLIAPNPAYLCDTLIVVQSGASGQSQDFVMFSLRVTMDGLPWQ